MQGQGCLPCPGVPKRPVGTHLWFLLTLSPSVELALPRHGRINHTTTMSLNPNPFISQKSLIHDYFWGLISNGVSSSIWINQLFVNPIKINGFLKFSLHKRILVLVILKNCFILLEYTTMSHWCAGGCRHSTLDFRHNLNALLFSFSCSNSADMFFITKPRLNRLKLNRPKLNLPTVNPLY